MIIQRSLELLLYFLWHMFKAFYIILTIYCISRYAIVILDLFTIMWKSFLSTPFCLLCIIWFFCWFI